MSQWGTPVEIERRTRIQLCLAAYGYETDRPIVSDAAFDELAKTSDPTILTGRHDQWWKDNFVPHSGMWVHKHPELDKLIKYFDEFYARIMA